MRLIEERRGSATISYVYEPGSYVPLARLDADGERTEQGGLGTTRDAQQPQTSKTIAASDDQTSAGDQKHHNHYQQPANESLEARYWEALNPKGTVQGTGTGGKHAKLCDVYYFHTDQVGLPEELSNAQGQLVWQASFKTWGSTVEERWEVCHLHGGKVHAQVEGDRPEGEVKQQNLRFQGQYLDRETGLHYNTFRYYDADVGRFISPDPIGLEGGVNLNSFAPNPISWIDPLGWANYPAVTFPPSKVLHETTILMQGDRNMDFGVANEQVDIKGAGGRTTQTSHKTLGDVVWHHADYDPATNTAKMQLVTTADHRSTFPHSGSVSQFEKAHGVTYGTRAAKDMAIKLNAKASAKIKC